jgi:NAD(P)-dependent dehydrogenase (short-subunit alcohol dehydrogenase family)
MSTNPTNPQRALVMGGSSGIGEATAARFLAAGAEVVITGRDSARLSAAAQRLGGKVTTHQVDATSDDDVAAFFADPADYDHLVLALGGRLGMGPLDGLDLAMLHTAFEAKFWAHLRILQAALARLRPDASITVVTAASARAALAGTAGLAAINGALEAVVPPLAVELAPRRVNAVSPGVVDTPWWEDFPEDQRAVVFQMAAATTPVGRVGQAEDVAEAIFSVATNGFISGTVLEVTGGSTLATGR